MDRTERRPGVGGAERLKGAAIESLRSWNYRIVRYHDGSGYGLHEVHYDQDGTPAAMTVNAMPITCYLDEGPEGVRKALERALADVTRQPVFEEPESWVH